MIHQWFSCLLLILVWNCLWFFQSKLFHCFKVVSVCIILFWYFFWDITELTISVLFYVLLFVNYCSLIINKVETFLKNGAHIQHQLNLFKHTNSCTVTHTFTHHPYRLKTTYWSISYRIIFNCFFFKIRKIIDKIVFCVYSIHFSRLI